MQQVHRRSAAAALCATLVALGLFPAVVDGKSLNDKQVTKSSTGFDRIRECAAQQKRLAVVFLVDESTSIRSADPQAARVSAIRRAVARLSLNLLATSGTSRPEIDVLVTTFGDTNSFTILGGDWYSLGNETTTALDEQIDDLRNRNFGRLTDYEYGLLGAEKSFIGYEQANGRTCKVLVWLSDGKMDLDNRTDPAPENESYARLCSPKGVAERLRNLGVYTFGIGLSPQGGEKDDFSRMLAIVEGQATCGGLGAATAQSPFGKFVYVTDASDLEAAFDNLFPAPPPPPYECDLAVRNPLCREFRISVSAPTNFIRLAIAVPGSVDTVELVPPRQSTGYDIFRGDSFVGDSGSGVEVEQFGANARVTVDVRSMKGEWALRVTGEDSARSSVALFSTAKPVVEGQPVSLVRDQPEPVVVTVRDPDLEGISVIEKGQTSTEQPTIVYELEATAKFGRNNVTATPSETGIGEFRIQFGDLADLPAQGTLVLVAQARIGAAEVPLEKIQIPLTLNWGDTFPQITEVSASPIDSGTRESRSSTVRITIQGPKEGTGQARIIGEGVFDLPPSMSDAQPTVQLSERSTVQVAAGETKVVEARIEPNGEANGILGSTLRVELTSPDGRVETTEVQIDIAVSKPLDVTEFVAVLLLALAAFVLLQLAVVWPIARRVARVRSLPVTTRVISCGISVLPSGQVVAEEGSLDTVFANHRNLGTAVESGLQISIRGYTLRGFPHLVYRGLFRPRRVEAFIKRTPDDPGELTIGQKGTQVVRDTSWGIISPNLSGVWAVSFMERDIQLIASNPQRTLPGHLLYIFPEGFTGDAASLGIKVCTELEMKGFRDNLPKMLLQRSEQSGTSGKGEPTISEVTSPRPPQPDNSKRKDLYS